MGGLRAAVALLLLAGTAAAQPAERRVALVIGNGQYQHVSRLANPTSDARLIAETLTGVGFTLVGGKAQLDLDKTALDRMVQEFGNALQGAGVALFYYAGHGVQVRGANYLVPVSANLTREADVDFQLLNVDLVLRQMEGAGTRLNLLILDACRNNPFAGRGVRAAGGGLAQMQAPEGTLLSYATQPGNVAQDGTDGHSPYTRALATAISKPGLDVFAVFNETGLEVKKRTGGAQQPWVSSSPIAGQFSFAGAPDQQPPVPPRPPPATMAGNDDAVEIAFWNSVKDAKNPAAFQAYLESYPQGKFASLARLKLTELSEPPQPGPQVAVGVSPPPPAPPAPPMAFALSAQELDQLSGEYELVSSQNTITNQPTYTKGWLVVQRLSQDRFGFILACGYRDSRTADCRDRWLLQYANGTFYRDPNGSPLGLVAMAVLPTLGQIHFGFPAFLEGGDRLRLIDIYQKLPPGKTITDADLTRRMRREQALWDKDKKQSKDFHAAALTFSLISHYNMPLQLAAMPGE